MTIRARLLKITETNCDEGVDYIALETAVKLVAALLRRGSTTFYLENHTEKICSSECVVFAISQVRRLR